MVNNRFSVHAGFFLRQIREVALEELHLTQEKVASDMKMSPQTLYRIEGGKSLKWETMDRLFTYYCLYDGVRENYEDAYYHLSDVDRIPKSDFLKLESGNAEESSFSECVLDLYRAAEEACEVKVRKISH